MPIRLETVSCRSLPDAELGRVVEVGVVDDALQVVGLGELADRDVDLLADVGLALERDQVVERAVLGHLDQAYGSALALSDTYFTKSSVRT